MKAVVGAESPSQPSMILDFPEMNNYYSMTRQTLAGCDFR